MITLINTNTMTPPIAPIGLDYVAGAAKAAGIEVGIVDLCLSDDPSKTLEDYFDANSPELVGLSFRNIDDCFWPSAQSLVPGLADIIDKIRKITSAPIILGGVGFSICAEQIIKYTQADFGIRGDGEQAIILLYNELNGKKRFEKVDGLIWRHNGIIRSNKPAWPKHLSLPVNRDAVDNITYFKKGGQCGLETKRGCNRQCIYCADPLAKGIKNRLRNPSDIADEAENLLAKGIDVLHLCDAEFNIPRNHAYSVCEELNRRSLGKNLRWYTYMAVVPFDDELAGAMSKAGCVGINFTGDSASPSMLETYRQPHLKDDLASAVRLCRANNMKVMIDLLLGGPGETPQTIADTISFIKQISPDCAGASLGIKIYPHTEMERIAASEGPMETNLNIKRKYTGPVDLLKPTFYISKALGENPAKLVRDLIAGDKRFFEPMSEAAENIPPTDHNYNDNTDLAEAIKNGARGAYWDILRKLRGC
jgi:radical SAM superfamily enzyme YgiQ (UPF0313 family)